MTTTWIAIALSVVILNAWSLGVQMSVGRHRVATLNALALFVWTVAIVLVLMR